MGASDCLLYADAHSYLMTSRIGIIGGSGVYDPGQFVLEKRLDIDTPYGKPSGNILLGKLNEVDVAFLPRHGEDHQYPPHKVPYHANIWAMKEAGVESIISPCAVGSLNEHHKPGEIVIVDQFIDFTKTREYTYHHGPETFHLSIADPFCPAIGQEFRRQGDRLGFDVHGHGTYVCIEGPRFSTKAESRMFQDYADVIGMTLVPECQLAREMGMCYCSLAMVTDYDVWKDHPVNFEMVMETMKANLHKVSQMLENALPRIEGRKCGCASSADGAPEV